MHRAMKDEHVMVCTDAGLASSKDIAGGKLDDKPSPQVPDVPRVLRPVRARRQGGFVGNWASTRAPACRPSGSSSPTEA